MAKFILVLFVAFGSGHVALAASLAKSSSSFLNLDLKQDRYLGEMQNTSQPMNFTSIAVDLAWEERSSVESPKYNFKFNPVAQNNISLKNEFYYGAPEIFLQVNKVLPNTNVTIGRQKRTWSALDEEFNVGAWQPQLRWDYLSPKQQGLTGFFLDFVNEPQWQVTFFWSPVFLPDQGPNYELKDGRFTSQNRWFIEPQSRVQMHKQNGEPLAEVPLYHTLNKPSEREIIEKQSFALSVTQRGITDPFWTRMSYAYKPQNQIHLGMTSKVLIGESRPPIEEIRTTIQPVVMKHHLLTLESGYTREDDSGYVSISADMPDASPLPAEYEESELNSMYIVGGSYSRYVFSLFNKPNWVKVAYMRLLNVQSKTKRGQFDHDEVYSSLDRYPLREVVALEWKSKLMQKFRNNLGVKARYNYSPAERGGWLSANLDLEQGPFTWYVGMDVLGSDVSSTSPRAGLFTRYSANDRVFGGVSYVF